VIPVTYCEQCTNLKMPLCSCGGDAHPHKNGLLLDEIEQLKEEVRTLKRTKREEVIDIKRCRYAKELDELQKLNYIYESDKKNFNPDLVPDQYSWLKNGVRPQVRKRDLFFAATETALMNIGSLTMKSMDAVVRFSKSDTAAKMGTITKQAGKGTIDMIHNYVIQECRSDVPGQVVDFGDLILSHENVFSTNQNDPKPLPDEHFLTRDNNYDISNHVSGNRMGGYGAVTRGGFNTKFLTSNEPKIDVPKFVSENGSIPNTLGPIRPAGVSVSSNSKDTKAQIKIRGANVDRSKCSARMNGRSVDIEFCE